MKKPEKLHEGILKCDYPLALQILQTCKWHTLLENIQGYS